MKRKLNVKSRGKKFPPRRSKIEKSKGISMDLKLVEVPIKQVAHSDLVMDGLGGQPSKTTLAP